MQFLSLDIFTNNCSFSLGQGSVFVEQNNDEAASFPPVAGNFELLDGTPFLLLDGTNFLLL